VLNRVARTISLARESRVLLDLGLSHLTLGRANVSDSPEATSNLNLAVDTLRRAGQLPYLGLSLLARGRQRDLDEAFGIATRSGMRLHLADYHLISAGNAYKGGDSGRAREHFEKAETLIRETGYHRRDGELAELRTKLVTS